MSDHDDGRNARTLTFIQPVGSKRSPRKIFGSPIDGVYPQINSGADFEKWTRSIYDDVATLRDAFEIFKVESARSSAFIHGQFLPGLGEVTYRRRLAKWGNTISIEDARRIFMMIDVDSLPPWEAAMTKMTPQEVWSWVRLVLPEEIRRADCILQLSQSFATRPGLIKAHVIVELSRALNWPERDKLLALSAGFDRKVNQPEQMTFIVDPVFQGCDDPLTGTSLADRWFYLQGETPAVEVPADPVLDDRGAEARRRKDEARRAKRGEQVDRFRGARRIVGDDVYRSGLDFYIEQIGAVGADGKRHFEEARLAAVRAFVAAEGEQGDFGTFLGAVRRHLQGLNPAALPHAGYVESVIADMPRLVSAWIERLRDRDLPQPCTWNGPQTVTLDVATVGLDLFGASTSIQAIELFEKRVGGLAARRAVEKLVEADRHADALALARAAGVYELHPDWSEEAVTPSAGWELLHYYEPMAAPRALDVTQGAGKTATGVKMGADAARAGLRVAMLVATHNLARELVGRFAAEGVTAAVWSGETQIGEDGEAACPRHVERTELCRAGLPADLLCGDRLRGFCPLRDHCRYRRQRAEVEAADVVLFCGASTLASKPPAPFRGDDVRRDVLDPATGKLLSHVTLKREPKHRRIGRHYLPPIDLLLIDEPVWTQLIEQPEKADAGKGPGVVALSELTVLAGMVAGDETLLPFVRALIARLSGVPGYWSHGDIRAVIADVPGLFSDMRLKSVIRAATAAVEKPEINPGRDVLATFAKSPTAHRNRLLMQAFRIARVMLAAVKSSRGAADDQMTPYLVSVQTAEGPVVHIRRVGSVQKQWRRAQVVVLDATYREELARRFLPDITAPFRIAVEAPERAMIVRQVFDSQVGVGKLTDMLAAWDKARKKGTSLPRRLRDLLAFVEIAAARVHGRGADGIDFLVVTIKPLADFLLEQLGDRKPPGLAIWHYNACRGLDEARGAAGTALIGRPLPAPEATSDLATLLSGEVKHAEQYQMAAAVYQSAADRSRGFRAEGARSVLPDPVMQMVADTVCKDALSHAIARVRPVRRLGAEVQAYVLTSEPVPNCPVDSFVRLDELLAPARNPFLLAVARGVAVAPNTKGGGAVISAMTGLTSAELRHWSQREGAPYARDAQLHQLLLDILIIGTGAVEREGAAAPLEGHGPRDIYDPGLLALRDIMSCGDWIRVRIALDSARYSVPARIRAQSLEAARSLWTKVTGRDALEVQDGACDVRQRHEAA